MKLFLRRKYDVITFSHKRNLFNQDFLGLTSFKKKRDEASASVYAENFIKIFRESYEDPNKKVFSSKIKHVNYHVKTKEDAELVGKALEKHAKTMPPKHIVFQQFSTGPEIMRMYHFFNMPIEGMSLLQNPVTLKFFADIKSYFIIQDSLYNNGFYKEVCELFKNVQDREFHGRKFPFLNYILFQAACYKLNTPDSYRDAMNALQDFIEYYKNPAWPILMYTMLFALEQGDPKLPLNYTLGLDKTSHNIRLAALIRSGDTVNAFKYFNKISKYHTVIHSVALELYSNLQKSVEFSSNKESEILKKNIDSNSFKNQTFEELAAETIHSLNSFHFS